MNDDIRPSDAPTGAVDWASEAHVGVIVDHEGQLLDQRQVGHTKAGLDRLLAWFRRNGVQRVAIERPDGPVVEALLDGGFAVFVVHPRQMKNLRGRYGNAGNKDDVLDAFVLADVLRTDWRRLRPLSGCSVGSLHRSASRGCAGSPPSPRSTGSAPSGWTHG